MTDPTPFGTALQERVRDEHPDLDELIRGSTRAGTRIRRLRRTGAVLAAATGVAAVAVGLAALQGGDGPTSGGVPIATQPTTAPLLVDEPAREDDLRTTLAALAEALRRQRLAPGAPVYVTAPGWQCTDPADEKYSCSAKGSGVAVNWRPAADRDYYLDPDKADVLPDVHTFVSPAHGEWFATVAPVEGTTQAEVDEVGASLVWVRD